jgi:hypothetical protein
VAITATVLTQGSSTTDELEYTTASISPGNDKLILVVVANGDTSGANNAPDVFDGDFNDVDPVISQQQGVGNQRISIFRAMSSSFPSGSFTIEFQSVNENVAWLVVEFGGVDTSGSNGSGAIVQSKGGPDSGTTQALTLDNAVGAGNATFGAVVGNTQTPVYAAGAGFELVGTGWSMSSPSNKGTAVWDVDGGNPITLTNDSTPTTALVGVEIKSGAAVHTAAAAVSGTAALTATGRWTANASAAASGTGALAAAAVRTTFASATASGTGALAASGVRTTMAAAAIAGVGALVAVGTAVLNAVATLATTTVLTASGRKPWEKTVKEVETWTPTEGGPGDDDD